MRSYKEDRPLYDVAGNSYATDSLLTVGGGSCGVTGWGAMFRPYSQVPFPSEQYLYMDGNGFYAAFWNMANISGNVGGAEDLEAYTWGWHGRNRTHNAAYVDGHAVPTLFEVRTDVTSFDSSTRQVVHTGNFDLRGGTAYNFIYAASEESGAWPHAAAAAFALKGPGWRNNSQPAPASWTAGLIWNSDCL